MSIAVAEIFLYCQGFLAGLIKYADRLAKENDQV